MEPSCGMKRMKPSLARMMRVKGKERATAVMKRVRVKAGTDWTMVGSHGGSVMCPTRTGGKWTRSSSLATRHVCDTTTPCLALPLSIR